MQNEHKRDEARQGEAGHGVRWVLAGGTALAVIVLTLALTIYL